MKFIQPTDENALGKLQDMAGAMSVEELKRFCEGTLNALVVVQDTFKRRFPAEWKEWNQKIEDGVEEI